MYRKETHGLIKHFDFVLLDLICLQTAFVLAYLLYWGKLDVNPYGQEIYRNLAIMMEVFSIVVMFGNDTFRDVLKRDMYREFTITVQHMIYVAALCILCLFLIRGAQQYSRVIIVGTFIIYTIITYIIRLIRKKYLHKRMVGAGARSLLIAVSENKAEMTIKNIKDNNYARFHIAGLVILDRDMKGQEIAGVPVVANVDNAAAYVCQQWIDEVLVIPQRRKPFPDQLMDELIKTGVTVHQNLAKITSIQGKKQIVENIANYTVLTTSMNHATTMQLMAKRMMDIVGGLVGCIITGILFIFIAPVIYISSPGPIFFAQERVGKNGKKFKMYKFRSMYIDAEERKAELMKQNKISDAKMFKMDFDPRVIGNKILPDGTKKTGIGQFIRDTSIDEFPQFFNVLKGDMSIVGTRPPIPGEVSLYELHHRARLAIKPGITGMWQVSGRSDITEFEEVVELDRRYINNWNLGMDLKILFKTVAVVFKKDGSM